jgi:hypothetical protein
MVEQIWNIGLVAFGYYCAFAWGIATGSLASEWKNLRWSTMSKPQILWVATFVLAAPLTVPAVALFVWFLRKAWRQNH